MRRCREARVVRRAGAPAPIPKMTLPRRPRAEALRWGRNAAIAAGAAGLMLALFSVGDSRTA